MERGEDVRGRLRDFAVCYVEECWGLLGCFEGDESARGGSMRPDEASGLCVRGRSDGALSQGVTVKRQRKDQGCGVLDGAGWG